MVSISFLQSGGGCVLFWYEIVIHDGAECKLKFSLLHAHEVAECHFDRDCFLLALACSLTIRKHTTTTTK